MEETFLALLGFTVVTITGTVLIIGFGIVVGIGCAIPAVLFSLPILWVRKDTVAREQEET